MLDTLAFERTTQAHELDEPLPRKQLEQLLALPICACLRSLILERYVDGDAMLGEQLAAAACAPGLRELRIEHVRNLDLQGDAFARLEALTIQGRFKLGPLRMPALRSLDVSIVVPLAPLASSFVQLDTPALEHFSIAGTPEDVAARVVELWEAGADRVELGTPQGRTTPAGVDLICGRVLPLLR